MMDRLQEMWKWMTTHPEDVWMAVILAAVVGVIVDLVAIGSRLRAGVRYLKNRWSAQSVSRLRTRIYQLEAQRDRYASYMSSDKGLYLATLQGLFFAMISIGFGAMCAGIADISRSPLFKLWSIAFYGGAVASGIMGLRFTFLDSRDKIARVIDRIGSEIGQLKETLMIKLTKRNSVRGSMDKSDEQP